MIGQSYSLAQLLSDPNRPPYAEERLFVRQWGSNFTDRISLKRDSEAERRNLQKSINEYLNMLKGVGKNRDLSSPVRTASPLPEWLCRPDFSLKNPDTFYACLKCRNLPGLLDEVECRLSHILRNTNPNLSTECSNLIRLAGKQLSLNEGSSPRMVVEAFKADIGSIGELLRAAVRQERARQVLHILALMQMHRDGVGLVGHQGAVHMLSQFGNQGQDVKVLRAMRLHLLQTAEKCESQALSVLADKVNEFLRGGDDMCCSLDKALDDVWSAERAVDTVADVLVLFSGSIWRGQQRLKSASHCVNHVDRCWMRVNQCVTECRRLLPKLYSSEFDKTTLPICLEILQSNFVRNVSKFVQDMDGLCELCERIRDKPWCGELTRAWLRSAFSANICKLDDRFKTEMGKQLDGERWTAELQKLNDQDYMVCRSACAVRGYMERYRKYFSNCWIVCSDWRAHWLELVRYFNSQSCQLLIGAGAVETAGLKAISVRHMAVGLRSLQYLEALMDEACKNDESDNLLYQSMYHRVRSDVLSHQEEIVSKILSTANEILLGFVSKYEQQQAESSQQPSPVISQVCKCIKTINDQISNLLSKEQHLNIISAIDSRFKANLRAKVKGADDALLKSDLSWYSKFVHALPGCIDVQLNDF